ncbi:hypothetical protein [Methylomicrobium sp. Wu6]|uniref:hypothetical protein n=1 Tax=Methylomicrobium sp. Wu6 TaxID=3107928 RepID=UPI002DD68458|nr:hypothetical protein [Methylomicrobium sp. Wu6]MEC4750028.1 hypothetical protein [Methylomicrobium sp. Wu6]
MAKYILIIEDVDSSNLNAPIDITVHQFLRIDENPKVLTKAGKLTRYAQLKLAELTMVSEQDKADLERMMGAARCCH